MSGPGSGVRINLDEDGGSGDSFTVWDAGAERFRVQGNTGNVGIGTTSPSGRLHVAKSGDPNIRIENTGDTSGGRNVSIHFLHSNGPGARISATRAAGDDDGMGLTFRTQPIGGSVTERMRIDPDGLVGTTPIARERIKAMYPDIDLHSDNLWFDVCDAFDETIGHHGWECLLDVAEYVERWKRENK